MLSFARSTAPELHLAATVLPPWLDRARELQVPLLLVGALARDVLAHHALGTNPARATKDVDIAVAVDTWDQVAELTTGLQRVGRSAHRFTISGVQVDVVPFAGIELPGRLLQWPDGDVMNVLGFSEALANAEEVELPGGTVVRVPSLAAQSVLKLSAWSDRGASTAKDAVDLRVILRAYHQGRHLDVLYTERVDLLEDHEFDDVAAGAALLGQEARNLLAPDDQVFLTRLLDDDRQMDRLCSDAGRDVGGNRSLFTAYRAGWHAGPDLLA